MRKYAKNVFAFDCPDHEVTGTLKTSKKFQEIWPETLNKEWFFVKNEKISKLCRAITFFPEARFTSPLNVYCPGISLTIVQSLGQIRQLVAKLQAKYDVQFCQAVFGLP